MHNDSFAAAESPHDRTNQRGHVSIVDHEMVFDRGPHHFCRRREPQPGEIVRETPRDFGVGLEAHHRLGPDMVEQRLGIGSDRIEATQHERAGDPAERNLVHASYGAVSVASDVHARSVTENVTAGVKTSAAGAAWRMRAIARHDRRR